MKEGFFAAAATTTRNSYISVFCFKLTRGRHQTTCSSLDQQLRLIFSAGDLKHSSVLGAQKVSRVIIPQFISVCVIWDWCTNFEFPAKMFIIKDQIWPWIWVLLALPIILIPVTCIYHKALSHFNIICWIRALCGRGEEEHKNNYNFKAASDNDNDEQGIFHPGRSVVISPNSTFLCEGTWDRQNPDVRWFSGCCTADSQTDAGRHRLYNNGSLVLFSTAWSNVMKINKLFLHLGSTHVPRLARTRDLSWCLMPTVIL